MVMVVVRESVFGGVRGTIKELGARQNSARSTLKINIRKPGC